MKNKTLGLTPLVLTVSLVLPAIAESKSGSCVAAAEHRMKFIEQQINQTSRQIEHRSVEECIGWTDRNPCDLARSVERNISRRKLIRKLEATKSDLVSYIKAIRSLENSLSQNSTSHLTDFYSYITRGEEGTYVIEPDQMERLVAHAQDLTLSGKICKAGEALVANSLQQSLFKVLDKAPRFASFSDQSEVVESRQSNEPRRLPYDKRSREGEVKVCGVFNNIVSGERVRLGCVHLGIKVLSIDREYVQRNVFFKNGDKYLPAKSRVLVTLLQTLRSGRYFPCHYVSVKASLSGDFLAELSLKLAQNLKFRHTEIENLIEMFSAEVNPHEIFALDVRTGGCGLESKQTQRTQLFLRSNDPRKIELEFSTSLYGVSGWGDM